MSTSRDGAEPKEPTGADSAMLQALLAGLDSMWGNSRFASLGDIVEVARTESGFTGTIEEALQSLQTAPAVEVTPAADVQHTQVRRMG